MSSKTSPGGLPPTILERPALGYSAHLGELYDQRRGKFLGVQMYDQTKVENGFIVEQDIKYSELSLSMSNSFDDKAGVIDINAELSVEILGGLISVKGSASYLNDYRSNTQSRAWAMSLKMRLNEKRLLFGEDDLGHDVLPVVRDDYIANDLATHFVSGIVYGGNVVVNLVARSAQLSEDEKIEGALEAQLEKLKGLVDLKGKADISIKNKFENLNDKFDVVLYGDMIPASVPANPQDVLDTFPDLAELITKDGGVPVSIILQPIPPELRQAAAIIRHIDQKLLEDILTAFGRLDDVASRFAVLKDGAKKYIDHIPKLDSATRAADAEFVAEHRRLLAALFDFISGSKSGTKTTSGTELVAAAEELYRSQTLQSGDYVAPNYPTNLAGLELAYSNFMGLLSRLHTIGHTLSTIEALSAIAGKEMTIPLFLMPPLSPHADDNLLQFTVLTRAKIPRFTNQDPPLIPHLLYVETPATLEAHFPNNKEFAKLKEPTLFVGKIDEVGDLTWAKDTGDLDARKLLVCDYNMHIQQTGVQTVGCRVTDLFKINTAKSFSIVLWAKRVYAHRTSATGDQYSEVLRLFDGKNDKIVFRSTKYFYLHVGTVELGDKKTTRGVNIPFYMTFVQDAAAKKWKLYVDKQKIDEKPIDGHLGPLCLLEEYPPAPRKAWEGIVDRVRFYSDALTDAQIATLSSVRVTDVEVDTQALDPRASMEERLVLPPDEDIAGGGVPSKMDTEVVDTKVTKEAEVRTA